MSRKIAVLFLSIALISAPCFASPWAEKEAYGEQVSGKFKFGLKNTLLGWTAIFTETNKYEHYLEKKSGWEGMWIGISKSIMYTATGMIQLVTFPIPVDLPNFGEGVLETSVKDQAAREQGEKKKVEVAVTAEAPAIESTPATVTTEKPAA